MTIFDTWLHSDLQRPLAVALLPGVFFAGDDQANRLNVRVTDDGRSASLAGTVTAYLIRSDESTLIVSGSLAGDTASVTLPEAAYAMPGPLDIVIKLISGDQRTAIGACRAYVARTTTDAIVDPGHVIPSLDELLALIERMEADMALIEGMTATAHGLDTLQPPTVTVTRTDGHYNLDFGIPKGATGDGGVSSVNGYAPDSQGNVTIPTATATADGLLSAADKEKLSGLSFPLPVNKGGTGRDFFTYGEVLMGNSTGGLLTKPITDISQDGDIGASLNLVNARTLVHYANYRLGDYLPLTGGTLTGDLIIDAHSLVINGAWYPHMQLKATQDGSTNEGRVEASHYGRLSLQSWNDETGDDRRVLDILNSSTGAPLAESLILREIVDGNNGTEYRVITSAGGTVNGPLEFTTPAASGAEILTFSQSAGFTELAICKSDDGTTRKRFAFRQYRPSGAYSETYVLPSTTNDITASANYDILTSKSAVTVAQGGTGANNAADARANLGIGSAQANRYQLGSGGGKVSLTFGGNTCLFSIIRAGTSPNPSARCVCVAEYWSGAIGVFGELPSQIVLQKSSNSNVITIQNNRTTAVVLTCVSGIFAAVDGTDAITQTATLTNYSYYVPGDTYKIAGPLGLDGYITSDAKGINFTVIVNKDLGYINTVTVTALTGIMRGVNGAIANSTTSTNWLTQSGVTVTASVNGPNVIRISMAFDSVPNNATANTIASLAASLTLSFS